MTTLMTIGYNGTRVNPFGPFSRIDPFTRDGTVLVAGANGRFSVVVRAWDLVF